MNLIYECEKFVESSKGYKNIHLEPILHLIAVFNGLSPEQSLINFQNRYSVKNLSDLEMLIDVLDAKIGETEISQDQLNDLKQKITTIKQEVMDSGMDGKLKLLLFEGTNYLLDAI